MIDSRYVQLEYLESNGTQYIDTGISPERMTSIIFDYRFVGGNASILGAYNSAGYRFQYYGNTTDASNLNHGIRYYKTMTSASPELIIKGSSVTDRHIVNFDFTNLKATVDNKDVVSFIKGGTSVINTNIYLFAGNNNGTAHAPSNTAIYSCKFYVDEKLVRDFVPAKRKSDNVLGMFDKVNNVFYTNIGTGSFIGGKEIKDVFRSRIVPHAYTQLSYLEGTGKESIDTGLKGNLNTELDGVFEIAAFNADGIANIAGDNTTSASAINFNFGIEGGKPTIRFGNKANSMVNQGLVANTKYRAITNKTAFTIYNMDGSVHKTFAFGTTTEFTTTNNISLFIATSSAVIGKARIFSFKIRESGVLVRDFIPVVRKIDNVAGMYDTVEGKFYTNAGTGSFIAGDIVNTADKIKIKEKKYQLLDYIQTNKKEYIDAGFEFDPSKNTTISIDLEFTELGTSGSARYIFGNTEASNKLAVNTYVSGAIYTYCGASSGKSTAIIPQLNQKYNIKVVATPTRYDYYLDDKLIATYTTGLPTAKIGMPLIFGNYWRGGTAVDDTRAFMGRFCGIKIIENGVLVRDFIPARRLSDNEVGMLDMVEGKFYGNASSQGAFIGSDNRYSGYEFYDYIQSSGTQYIDTGIKAIANSKVEMKFNRTAYAGQTNVSTIFGGYDSNQRNYGLSIDTARIYWLFGGQSNALKTFPLDTDYTVVFDGANKTFTVGDFTQSFSSLSLPAQSNGNIYLFTNSAVGSLSQYNKQYWLKGKIYYFKYYENEELVRDLVPAKRKSDNAVGMLDIANNVFYANQGTGVFTTGNKVPAPDGYYEPKEVQELRLPYNGNKYKFFDYIESSGTQWIDTGKLAPLNTDIEVRFSFNSVATGAAYNGAIFGGRNSQTSRTCTLFYLASTNPHYFRFDRQNQAQFATANEITHRANDVYKFTLKNNIDLEITNETTGEVAKGHNVGDPTTFTESPLALFAVMTGTTAGTFLSGRIYDWKYWNDGKLVQHLIPAQRLSDNAIGMFDKITNTFFENKGTGVFKTGNEIVSIPNEYERLEYLESSGTQYIDTNLSVDSYGNNEMIVSLEYTDVTASQLFGANNGGYFGVRSGADYNVSSKTVAVNTPYIYDIKRSGGKYTRILNGTSYSTGTIQTRATTSVYLFAIAGFTSMSYTKCKVKHFEYYVDGILVRNLFPVRRKADNVLGMLDLVNNTFYTNAGTGSFTASTNTMPNKVMMPFWKRYPDVPKEYEVKEYLESDGYAQIDSGIRFTQGDKIDMVGRFIDPKHDDGLICMTPWNQGNSSRFMFACATTGGTPSFCMSYNTLAGGSNKVSPYFTPDTEYHRWTYEDLTLTIDDGVSSLTNTEEYPDDSKITGSVYLFRRFNGGCKTAIKYYNHWRNGQLIASYVPVRRKSDNVLGMYDMVSDSFLTNLGTGSFTTNE